MTLPLKPPFPPMEAELVAEPPEGDGWQYEPKWDGFRCLAFRDGEKVYLQSKSGKPLARYFPDVVAALSKLRTKRFVVDGEIVIPIEGRLSFDELLLRVHPAASRVKNLAAEHPALLVLFDLLVDARGTSLIDKPLRDRRQRLLTFAKGLSKQQDIRLSPASTRLADARKWFRAAGGNLDGIVAKRLDLPYLSGSRDGMRKVKHRRTADCVVGGFRYTRGKRGVASLLLGLYDEDGKLNLVGFSSAFSNAERRDMLKIVEPLRGGTAFSGRAPGKPSRWSQGASQEWESLEPKLVVEVEYDHFTNDRFRHGTSFVRWRPDKRPEQCAVDQIQHGRGSTLKLLQ